DELVFDQVLVAGEPRIDDEAAVVIIVTDDVRRVLGGQRQHVGGVFQVVVVGDHLALEAAALAFGHPGVDPGGDRRDLLVAQPIGVGIRLAIAGVVGEPRGHDALGGHVPNQRAVGLYLSVAVEHDRADAARAVAADAAAA